MDYVAASFDQTHSGLDQLVRAEWLGKHGNRSEGLWKPVAPVSGDEHERHLHRVRAAAISSTGRPFRLPSSKAASNSLHSMISSACLTEPVDATTSAPASSVDQELVADLQLEMAQGRPLVRVVCGWPGRPPHRPGSPHWRPALSFGNARSFLRPTGPAAHNRPQSAAQWPCSLGRACLRQQLAFPHPAPAIARHH